MESADALSTPPTPGGREFRDSDELRAWLAAIVDSSDDAIVSKTLDGIITSWNRGAEELFGYSAAEAIGQHIYLIIPDDRREEEKEVLARLGRGEKVDHFETVRRRKDGRLVHISLTVSPVRDGSGKIIGASKVARDITARIAEADLELWTRLVLAQEDERRRIARELHDQLGQQLTALRLTLEMLKMRSDERPELRAQIETLQELALQLDKDVAFRVWELRPLEMESVGLHAALTQYVQNWSQHFGVNVQLHASPGSGEHLPPEVAITIYRVAQEALNNIVKHARAARVDVVLERRGGYVSLVIEDDGRGFDQAAAESGRPRFGLIGMRERAALVGGELQIESAPGRGTTVFLRTPVESAAGSDA
jgi:PAS domain S-box-containing protein